MHEYAPVIRCTPKVMDGKSEEFVHGKLVITGNRFENPALGTHCIWLEYLREAEIVDNEFDAEYQIKTHHSGNITDRNNKTEC